MTSSKYLIVIFILIAAIAAAVAYQFFKPPPAPVPPTPALTPTPTPTPTPLPLVGIGKFASQEEVKAYLNEVARARLTAIVPFGIERALVPFAAPMEALPAMAPMAALPERVATTYVQVVGIDEPDMVKSDGLRIYFSPQAYRKALHVFDAYPPERLSEISKLNVSGDLLLHPIGINVSEVLVVIASDALYGYSLPSLEARWKIELNYTEVVSARYHDGKIYLVTRRFIDYLKPCPIDLLRAPNGLMTIACDAIYRPTPPVDVDVTYHALLIDPSNGVVEKSLTFVGSSRQSVLYMSRKALYVTYHRAIDEAKVSAEFFLTLEELLPKEVLDNLREIASYNISSFSKLFEFFLVLQRHLATLKPDDRMALEAEISTRREKFMAAKQRELERTVIVKIALPHFEIAAMGEAPGRVLNQFALDEYNGHLRIATTIGRGDRSVNDVYVLDANLNIVGMAKDLGKGERIYAVRFVGDRGYVVTFREIDPFYVLDLSDPAAPQIKGELKIPGYSSFLFPIAEHVVLGIGMEDLKVKVALFDVSSPAKPRELDKYLLNESFTEILKTHHAFMIDDKHQLFFLPTPRGGYIFSYKRGEEYVLALKMAVALPNAKRALYIGDYLYVLGEGKIVVVDELNFTKVKELEFEWGGWPKGVGPIK